MATRVEQRTRIMSAGAILTETNRGMRSMTTQVFELWPEGCTIQVPSQVWGGDVGRIRIDVLGEVWFPVIVRRVARSSRPGWAVVVEFDRMPDEKRRLVDEFILRENCRLLDQFAAKLPTPPATV